MTHSSSYQYYMNHSSILCTLLMFYLSHLGSWTLRNNFDLDTSKHHLIKLLGLSMEDS